ncbi:MAG: winged helix-turn-helix transcriptional regulator [Bacteroidia bacterium]|nr:winged helix-turn-helix transcriptional regulator [Bacteroidia bacterium]MCU0361351.1 autorepressor SdpR family transcription factor [Bacteroidia bacterium]
MNLAFKALNDATRREILELLRKKDLTAGEIAGHFSISAPSISHHLDLLRRAGLIESEKKGQFVIYRLDTTVLDDILSWMLQFNKKPSK